MDNHIIHNNNVYSLQLGRNGFNEKGQYGNQQLGPLCHPFHMVQKMFDLRTLDSVIKQVENSAILTFFISFYQNARFLKIIIITFKFFILLVSDFF